MCAYLSILNSYNIEQTSILQGVVARQKRYKSAIIIKVIMHIHRTITIMRHAYKTRSIIIKIKHSSIINPKWTWINRTQSWIHNINFIKTQSINMLLYHIIKQRINSMQAKQRVILKRVFHCFINIEFLFSYFHCYVAILRLTTVFAVLMNRRPKIIGS